MLLEMKKIRCIFSLQRQNYKSMSINSHEQSKADFSKAQQLAPEKLQSTRATRGLGLGNTRLRDIENDSRNSLTNEDSKSDSSKGRQPFKSQEKYQSANATQGIDFRNTKLRDIQNHSRNSSAEKSSNSENEFELKKINMVNPNASFNRSHSSSEKVSQLSEDYKPLGAQKQQSLGDSGTTQRQPLKDNYQLDEFELPDHTANKRLSFAQVLLKDINKYESIQRGRRKAEEASRTRNMDNDSEADFFEPSPKRGVPQSSRQYDDQFLKPQESDQKQVSLSYNFFSGKLSVVWLFVFSDIEPQLKAKIKAIYECLTDRDFQIPLCRSWNEAAPFFETEGSVFKVIVDLNNGESMDPKQQYFKKVLSISIYNNDKVRGFSRAASIKQKSKKVKGSYTDLTPLLKRASQEIENGNRFMKGDDGKIQEVKFQSKLPAFMRLSGQDKTEITKYRNNLYGSIKLSDPSERQLRIDELCEFVRRVFGSNLEEMKNLESYLEISHIEKLEGAQLQRKYFEVLRFYVQETFYYKVTNNILRISRSIEDFKPITVPFNQNYLAIKHFYAKAIKEDHRPAAYKLYRGAPVNHRDLQVLKPGNFIELLGFVSTSKSENYVRDNFLSRRGDYLFVFDIKAHQKRSEVQDLDHGFVDLSRFGIATPEFEAEEEVLLNALNIYKVVAVETEEDSDDGVGKVFLEYGAIFELLKKDQEELTEVQKGVVDNYKYCAKQMRSIEDHGDVLREAQDYEKCKQFYEQRVKEQVNSKNFNKLAEAVLLGGDADEARLHALRSLELFEKEVDIYEKQDLTQVSEKNAEVFKSDRDTYSARKCLDFELSLLGEDEWLLRAKKLQSRAEILLEEGDVAVSRQSLEEAEKLILEKLESFERRRVEIGRRYTFRYFIGCCCFANSVQLEAEKERELQQVAEDEHATMKVRKQIYETLLKINASMQGVCEFAKDSSGYEACVAKGVTYFQAMSQSVSQEVLERDNFMKAKLKIMEANVTSQLESSDEHCRLLEEAALLIEKQDPMNQKIADINLDIGAAKNKSFHRGLLQPVNSSNKSQKSHSRISNKGRVLPIDEDFSEEEERFDHALYEQNYMECKKSFQKAAQIAAYHGGEEHPRVLEAKNNISELSYSSAKFSESQEQSENILRTNTGTKHQEGAKSALILCKIYLSRGEVKFAFQMVEKSAEILRRAIVKEPGNSEYEKLFRISPVFVEQELWKSKTYNRQMKHDLALQTIQQVEAAVAQKMEGIEKAGILADIYEEHGNTLSRLGRSIEFEKLYHRAIKARENEMGKYNICNGIALCTLFKEMLRVGDTEACFEYLDSSQEIFDQFPSDHPNAWIYFTSVALLCEKNQQKEDEMKELRRSVDLMQKKYSKSMISFMKVRSKYGDALTQNSQFEEALSEYEQLSTQLGEDLTLSQQNALIETPIDDEKLAIQEHIETSISKTQKQLIEVTQKRVSGESSLQNFNPRTSTVHRSKKPLISDSQINSSFNVPTNKRVEDQISES